MTVHTFYIVDVFAEQRFAGNQLAVIREAGDLTGKEMQAIAGEMNYSETTFILSDSKREGGYDVRIFTPAEELPFAGHPTLGTAFILRRELEPAAEEIRLNLGVGQIPVSFSGDDGIIWMQQRPPRFGSRFSPEQIARLLNVRPADIDPEYPCQEVSTGLPFIIVPLKDLQAIQTARVELSDFLQFIADIEAKSMLVFCPQAYNQENQLNVRVFTDYYGIPEDPATGSANGCLAGYLSCYRYFGSHRVAVRVEQGYEINRPSLLYLRAHHENNNIAVQVGGRVVLTARGELL